MRWKVDRMKDRIGEQRVITRFLWYPVTFDGETRWLERATLLQEIKPVDVGGSMEWGVFQHQWVDIAFLETERA